ncbi:MAG: HAMP domain-containing histidine kinase [Kiritimatiellae bacterium]|nr:HAMP domain-containing histidine kinase [Kiritimatiellia bacterium]
MRAHAVRILALGAVMLLLLVCTLSAGGILLVYGLRRERRDARRKADFIDNVSHELKTPLAGIRLNAELLAEGRISDEAKRRSAIHAIIIEADRLSNMVSELLDFSRLEKATWRYNIETFDLAALATQDSEGQVVAAISQGRARITAKGEGTPVMADKDALRQIGVNLVTNAAKYSDGEIEIEVEGPEIRWKDRGPGIPHGSEERIFERFYRVDNSLAQATSGSGLGLPIARALARGMGGDLAYSPRPGGGSIFTLTLKKADSTT